MNHAISHQSSERGVATNRKAPVARAVRAAHPAFLLLKRNEHVVALERQMALLVRDKVKHRDDRLAVGERRQLLEVRRRHDGAPRAKLHAPQLASLAFDELDDVVLGERHRAALGRRHVVKEHASAWQHTPRLARRAAARRRRRRRRRCRRCRRRRLAAAAAAARFRRAALVAPLPIAIFERALRRVVQLGQPSFDFVVLLALCELEKRCHISMRNRALRAHV